MKTVKEILQTKQTGLITIAPDATVFDALKLMAEKNIGALPVMPIPRSATVMQTCRPSFSWLKMIGSNELRVYAVCSVSGTTA